MTATETTTAESRFVAEFERRAARAAEPAWLAETRRAAIDAFARKGFPNTRVEEWRQTSLSGFRKIEFAPRERFDLSEAERAAIEPFAFDRDMDCIRLVFANGRFVPALSNLAELPAGLEAGSLADAIARGDDGLRAALGACANADAYPFAALNAALFEDGAFVRVAPGATVERPILVRHVSTDDGSPRAAHPRNLFVAGEGAKATVIETYLGLGGTANFSNPLTEILAGAGATLEHLRIQRENAASFHIGVQAARVETKGRLASRSIVLGAALSRLDIAAVLAGENCECALDGLYLTDGDRHADTHTHLDHAAPNCRSHQLYKGILAGESSGVFNGWILVRREAQKTDAIQSNHALLLSDAATIDTQPQLEIYADDVKCTHGATIGQLEDEAIFYLRSRGIGEAEARAIMIGAFAGEVLDHVGIEPLHEHLEGVIRERLGRG